MALDDLVRACPPPTAPVHVPDEARLRALAAELGLPLPPDYAAFLSAYGSGCFGSFEPDGFFDLAYVMSPGEPDHSLTNARHMRRLTEDLRAIQERFPERVAFATRPSDGGLVYFGGTTTQHCFYWKTLGPPEAWTVVAGDRYCEDWFEWAGDLTSFLAALVERRVPDWILRGPTRFPLVFADQGTLANVELV